MQLALVKHSSHVPLLIRMPLYLETLLSILAGTVHLILVLYLLVDRLLTTLSLQLMAELFASIQQRVLRQLMLAILHLLPLLSIAQRVTLQ